MADMNPARGYKGALAIRQPNVKIHCRQAGWPWLLDGVYKAYSSNDSPTGCGSPDLV